MNVSLPLPALFRFSTIEEMAAAIGAGAMNDRSRDFHTSDGEGFGKGLSDTEYRKMLEAVAGCRVPPVRPGSLMIGLHIDGREAPLFWCFNTLSTEAPNLARELGAEQPLYGLFSGSEVVVQDEDWRRCVASHYVEEITRVKPSGPYRLGGNCGGGWVACEIACELLKRGYEVERLCVMEYFEPRLFDYPGPLQLLFSLESDLRVWERFHWSHSGWEKEFRTLPSADVISGPHGTFFTESNVKVLGKQVRRFLHRGVVNTADALDGFERATAPDLASWVKETYLVREELEATVMLHQRRALELENVVSQREERIAGLEGAVAQREERIFGLEDAVAQREERMLAFQSQLASAEKKQQELQQVKKGLLYHLNGIQLSATWQLARPFRAAETRWPKTVRALAAVPKGVWWALTLRLPGRLGLSRKANQLIEQRLFDIEWYVNAYPDIVLSGLNPALHWLVAGWTEGRDPNPLFDCRWYLANNPDVAEAGMNPLVHFVDHGAAEGRDPNPSFNTSWYLSSHPELASKDINPLARYLEYGLTGGYDPNPFFNTQTYIERHPEVAELGLNPLVHSLSSRSPM